MFIDVLLHTLPIFFFQVVFHIWKCSVGIKIVVLSRLYMLCYFLRLIFFLLVYGFLMSFFALKFS